MGPRNLGEGSPRVDLDLERMFKPTLTKHPFTCVWIFALATVVPPALAGDDCETRIEKLEASKAEGEERLAEKHEVIGFCASQYKHDEAIGRLVKQCAKYEEQPVVNQQFVAELPTGSIQLRQCLAHAEGGVSEIGRWPASSKPYFAKRG